MPGSEKQSVSAKELKASLFTVSVLDRWNSEQRNNAAAECAGAAGRIRRWDLVAPEGGRSDVTNVAVLYKPLAPFSLCSRAAALMRPFPLFLYDHATAHLEYWSDSRLTYALPCPALVERHRRKAMPTCFVCGSTFSLGRRPLDGRHIASYAVEVCRPCYDFLRLGWGSQDEKRLIAHLLAQGLPLPKRNQDGLLPRE